MYRGKIKYIQIFFILLIFLALTAACSLPGSREDKNVAWQNEVLLASECGQDGLPCCPDKDQPCRYEQVCCSDPSDPKRNRCTNECACGKLNGYCCADDPQCADGLACFKGDCVKCGGADEPCCTGGEECRSGLICYNDRCLECGSRDHPCCGSGQACLDEDKRDAERTGCIGGGCLSCGYESIISCPAEPYCNPSHLLNNGLCLKCGGFNQPCCQSGSALGACDAALNLSCNLGFCAN